MPKIIFAFLFSLFCCVPAFASNATTNATVSDDGLPSWVTYSLPPYYSQGKIDPFVSFVRVREYESFQAAKRLEAQKKKSSSPLETVDVRSLRVIGIINQGSSSLAMVSLPDGKGYLVRKGMRLGLYGGVVSEITHNSVVISEKYEDPFGDQKTRSITLKLRQEKE